MLRKSFLVLFALLMSSNLLAKEEDLETRTSVGGEVFLGIGLNRVEAASGYAFSFEMHEQTSKFSYGLDFGWIRGGEVTSAVRTVATLGKNREPIELSEMFRILPTFVYRGQHHIFRPYLGVSVGPAFTASNYIEIHEVDVKKKSGMYLMALGRMGMDIHFTKALALSLEPLRLGYYRGTLLVNPMANVAVVL
jgi:hypothetical protein